MPRVFLAFSLKFWKKMPKAGAKRAIFASKRGLVGEFYIQKPLAFGF